MTLQQTVAPVRPFLDWPVATDPSAWDAEVALLGIPRGEPYPRDPQPNDQSRAPDAIRSQSSRFCYAPGNWDFDTGTDPASVLRRTTWISATSHGAESHTTTTRRPSPSACAIYGGNARSW